MCNNETHFELIPSAHVTRHAMAVGEELSRIRFNREGASVDYAEANAQDALELIDANPDVMIDLACVEMFRSVVSGRLRTDQKLSA